MAVEKFKNFLDENDIDICILESNEKTHTAQQAANAHNIAVRNIIKSILVKIDSQFILFLVPGNRQIDLDEKKNLFEAKKSRIANADEVKNITGYSIGGVPPFGHKTKIPTYIENGFDENSDLLGAGGSPNSVFKISLGKLKKIISEH